MTTIYIIEDDQNIREIETFALKNSGYEVIDFERAKDFYKEIDKKIPEIYLTVIHVNPIDLN